MFRNLKDYILILFLLVFGTGCSLQYQLKSYVQFYFHDLEVVQDKIFILLGKERYSPEVSLSAAMMNQMSTGTSYSLLSYGLLSFEIKEFGIPSTLNLSLLDKKNILTARSIPGVNPHVREKIIDWNRLLFNYDIINENQCLTLLILNKDSVSHISCEMDIIPIGLSFDKSEYSYLYQNRMFIYNIDAQSTTELRPTIYANDFGKQFESTKYIIGDNWFVDLSLTENKLAPYKLTIINKTTGQVNGTILSKYRTVKDLNLSRGLVLAYRLKLGLKIFDLEGNTLYSLGDEWVKNTSRAILHEDKVYAAGITTRDTPLGKKDYIEIIQWDYKNDSVIKKYYPCDSPELEM